MKKRLSDLVVKDGYYTGEYEREVVMSKSVEDIREALAKTLSILFYKGGDFWDKITDGGKEYWFKRADEVLSKPVLELLKGRYEVDRKKALEVLWNRDFTENEVEHVEHKRTIKLSWKTSNDLYCALNQPDSIKLKEE